MKKLILLLFLLIPFGAIAQTVPGTVITAPVVPNDLRDEMATHIDSLGAGGYRSVPTISARNSIKQSLRLPNMLVYVGADSTIYRLNVGLTNNDWMPLSTGGTSMPEPTADGKPYSRMVPIAQTEGQWVESTTFSNPDNLENAPIFITDGSGTKMLSDNGQYIEGQIRTTLQRPAVWKGYYEAYVDIVNGNDNPSDPTDPLDINKPLKTLEGVISWLGTIFAGSEQMMFYLSDGDYSNYSGTSNLFWPDNACQLASVTGVYFLPKGYTTSSTTTNENVIMPRIHATSGMTVACNSLRIRPNGVNGDCIRASRNGSLTCYYCVFEGIVGLSSYFVLNSGSGAVSIQNCTFRPARTSMQSLVYGNSGSFVLTNNNIDISLIGQNLTLSNATIHLVLNCTADLRNPVFKNDSQNKITGRKFLAVQGSILWERTAGALATIPGTTVGTYAYGADFANSETINQFSETAPSDPTNSQLTWRGNVVNGGSGGLTSISTSNSSTVTLTGDGTTTTPLSATASITEADPVWTAAQANYYTKTQSVYALHERIDIERDSGDGLILIVDLGDSTAVSSVKVYFDYHTKDLNHYASGEVTCVIANRNKNPEGTITYTNMVSSDQDGFKNCVKGFQLKRTQPTSGWRDNIVWLQIVLDPLVIDAYTRDPIVFRATVLKVPQKLSMNYN